MPLHTQYPSSKEPMLSGKFKYPKSELPLLNNYPYVTSPKVDGIRCCIGDDGTPYTRTVKAIPNIFIRERIKYLTRFLPELKYLDGELIKGPPNHGQLTKPNIFQETTSAVMSHGGEPEITFWFFDSFEDPTLDYRSRFLERTLPILEGKLALLNDSFKDDPHHKVHFRALPFNFAYNLEDINVQEELAVMQGYEGLMFRNPDRPYKFGRSATTRTQQHLVKLVRWETTEGRILDFEELQHNDNASHTDERGYAKRSTAKAGKRGGDTLGKFMVEILAGPFKGSTVSVGTGDGLTHSLRATIWNNQESYRNQVITFKYRDHGSKELPRFPIFKGFRDPIDFTTTN